MSDSDTYRAPVRPPTCDECDVDAPPDPAGIRFAGLLPESAVLVEATPSMWDSGLLADEAVFVRNAVPSRRREFTAGRNALRHALDQLGLPTRAILVGRMREPVLADGVTASITHTADYCAAAAMKQGATMSIGIDAETNTPMESELRRLIVSPEEDACLSSALHDLGCDGAKLAFSVKEAFFKAFFQQARQYLDWRDVEIVAYPERGEFAATVLENSVPAYFRGRQFKGRFRFDALRIYSALALPAESTR
jgi:4'-phosphopantetheinyl transferase EntD